MKNMLKQREALEFFDILLIKEILWLWTVNSDLVNFKVYF